MVSAELQADKFHVPSRRLYDCLIYIHNFSLWRWGSKNNMILFYVGVLEELPKFERHLSLSSLSLSHSHRHKHFDLKIQPSANTTGVGAVRQAQFQACCKPASKINYHALKL